MYTGLIHTHSLLRWILLILMVVAIVKAYGGWKGKRVFGAADKKPALFTLIAAHLQLVLGLILYMVSPMVQAAMLDMGVAMKDKILRFWAVEHVFGMVIAIVLITMGYSLSKRAKTDEAKFKRIFIYFLIALLLILATVPWPFTAPGQGRPWI